MDSQQNVIIKVSCYKNEQNSMTNKQLLLIGWLKWWLRCLLLLRYQSSMKILSILTDVCIFDELQYIGVLGYALLYKLLLAFAYAKNDKNILFSFHAWKRLAFWLVCVFVTFPYVVLGEVGYLFVLIPGLEIIKLEYILKLNIKRNEWLLEANLCTLFRV